MSEKEFDVEDLRARWMKFYDDIRALKSSDRRTEMVIRFAKADIGYFDVRIMLLFDVLEGKERGPYFENG